MARSIPQNQLQAHLRTNHLGRVTAYHRSIPSTQDEARKLARGGAPHGVVVWAGEQTAGRGRLDRSWHSAAGAGLWFSIVLRPSRPVAEVSALPLVVGVSVGTALGDWAPGQVRLKWPNDVLLAGGKVAGILVEGHAEGALLDYAVVGVGVNLSRPAAGFPADIAGTAAVLEDLAPVPSAAAVLATILGHLEVAYDELLERGPAAARAAWLGMADTIGREVVAHAGPETIRGRAVDLDAEGNLVVETLEGPRTVTYGEIQHLR